MVGIEEGHENGNTAFLYVFWKFFREGNLFVIMEWEAQEAH